jgi:Arc/MetJ family transcription regulator
MRTNIDIDDDLLEEAKRVTKITVKKDLVHEALRILIATAKRKSLQDIKGKDLFSDSYNYKSARIGK